MCRQADRMGTACVWIGSLLFVTFIAFVSGQGSCTICGKYTNEENCTQEYISPYPIDGQMCVSIANNKHIETVACRKHKSGYRIICKTHNSDSSADVLLQRCAIDCPPPKIIKERYRDNASSRILQPITLVTMVVLLAHWTVRNILC